MRKNATHQGLQARNDPYLLYRGAGAKGLLPLSPAPQIPADLSLRFAPEHRSASLRKQFSPLPESANSERICVQQPAHEGHGTVFRSYYKNHSRSHS
jgi:hypothetical protein